MRHDLKSNRISSYPTGVYCGLAPRLGEAHGASRAALQSSAFHAKIAGAENATSLWHQLTPEEQAECAGWEAPHDVELFGVTLSYAKADTEIAVTLYEDLDGVIGEAGGEDDRRYSHGHADMAWCHIIAEGRPIVVIGDAKRTRWTASLDSLQLDGYGWAYARATGAAGYLAGLWILDEGKWLWRDKIVWLDDFDSIEIAAKLKIAMLNSGPAVTGSHCSGCYSRLHCPEYLIPAGALIRHSADANITYAAKAFEEGLTQDNASEAYHLWRVAEHLVKRMAEQVKAYAQEHGIDVGGGKAYRLVETKGRASFDAAAMKKAYPEIHKEFMRPGKPGAQLREVKA